MKKIIFTILLSILTLASHAQKDSLYVDGMKWVTGYFDFGQDTIDEVYPISHKYIIDGDSVIKGVKYKKLLEFYTCNWVEDDYYVTDYHPQVCNFFSQFDYGYDGKRYTSYDAFWNCLNLIKNNIPKGKKIGFPGYIGCVRGGANWDVIHEMINQTLGQDYEVYIYFLEK